MTKSTTEYATTRIARLTKRIAEAESFLARAKTENDPVLIHDFTRELASCRQALKRWKKRLSSAQE